MDGRMTRESLKTVFRNTPTAVRVYAGQAGQTCNADLIEAMDALYVRTLEAYAHARFYPAKPKVTAVDGRRYRFDNGWVVDMEQRDELEASPSHRNIQRQFVREAARMIFDLCGLKDRELLDYAPYHNRVLQLYGVMDSFGWHLAYVSFWGRTVALLDSNCDDLLDCVYATGASAPALENPNRKRPDKTPRGESDDSKRSRRDRGKPRGG